MTSKDFQLRTFSFNLPIIFILITLLAFSALILTDKHQQGKTTLDKITPNNAKTLALNNLPMPNIAGEKAKEYLKEQGLYESLGEAMQAARYSINPTKNAPLPDQTEVLEANNPRQGFLTYFAKDGIHLVSNAKGNKWRIKMNLEGFGYGDKITPVRQGKMQVQKNKSRIEIEKSSILDPQPSIVEWYENSSGGLEQGWTIKKKPSSESDEELKLVLELGGNLKAKLASDKQAINFVRENDEQVVRYDKLKSWDANGKKLTSRMELDAKTLAIIVNDKEAQYPITIDPFFTQTKKITASDGASNDQFGISVAISGDTALVGAFGDDDAGNASGSAYIFERNTGGANIWGEVKKLTASDAAANDRFGYSVGICGDTAIVGAYQNDTGGADRGAAYIFNRNSDGMGGTSANFWGEVKKLTSSDAADGDWFGWSVAISGDTAIVGAVGNEESGLFNSGAAYVFERNSDGMGGTSVNFWGEVKKLTASNAGNNAQFGSSVAISNDTAIVGAAFADRAYIFERNSDGMGGTSANFWGEVQQLTGSPISISNTQYGFSVAISGDTAIVGAHLNDFGSPNRGSAYIYERNQGGVNNWGQVKHLNLSTAAGEGANFGYSVGISGNTVIVGARNWFNGGPGAAYIFERNTGGADNWGEAQLLTASDGATDDRFGVSVAISGGTAIVGAALDDPPGPVPPGTANGVSPTNVGSAYIFTNQFNNWTQRANQTSSDGSADDQLGFSVSISGDTAVVGAYLADVGMNAGQGAAYIFERNQGGADIWGQFAKLTASDGAASDQFGFSVSISGDTVIVGANQDDDNGQDSGSAYIFTRNTGGVNMWGQAAKITATTDGGAFDWFGYTVSISGDTVIVGAVLDDDNGMDSGSAFIFNRNQGGADTWGKVLKIVPSDGAFNDSFGYAVSISLDTAVVSARLDDDNGDDSGSVYVYERNTGGADNWGLVQKITASDGMMGDSFGSSVSINMDTVIVGASLDDGKGAAYIFSRNTGGADMWGQVTKITASDGAADDRFGGSVSISGDTAVVAARFDDDTAMNSGSVYVFERNSDGMGGTSADNWGQIQKLTASNAAADDLFGYSVAISGDNIIIGAKDVDIAALRNSGDDKNSSKPIFSKMFDPTPRNLAGANQGAVYVFNAVAAPTAAFVSVAGKVTTSAGRGIGRVSVRMNDLEGNVRLTRTNPFGYFQFTGVEVGRTYVIEVSSKHYRFDQESQAITVQNDLKDIRFTGFER